VKHVHVPGKQFTRLYTCFSTGRRAVEDRKTTLLNMTLRGYAYLSQHNALRGRV
jgi:hypothetical protein